MSTPTPDSEVTDTDAPALRVWRYVGRLAPLGLLWIVMAGLLGWLLYSRAAWNEQSDRSDMREWVENTRIFRKTLSELVKEYVDLVLENDPGAEHAVRVQLKLEEIEEHVRAMTEPTRVYQAQLPLFPEIFKFEIEFSGLAAPDGRAVAPIRWESPKPRPGGSARAQLRSVAIDLPLGRPEAGAAIRLDYRLHTYNRMQSEQDEYRFWQTVASVVLLPTTVFVGFLVMRFLRRERARELDRWRNAAAAEHRERELLQAQVQRELVERHLLESRVKQQEAERASEDLGRKVLEQQLETARLGSRAAEAEKAALTLKSEIYASIGIMAGSYAHNIKNLLVRPNDLLVRCIESDGVSQEQQGMLQEVQHTLGTVTERLQQILRTVRRDPANAEITRVDLAAVVKELQRTWGEMGREKWKLTVSAELPDEPLWVNGDLSHLQQAVENLLFNARDATFEKRNHLRDEAKCESDPARRRHRLLDAAAWRGDVRLRVTRAGDHAVLSVQDNGIGMTEEVRKNCLNSHYSTKRDNALYEGYNAGMGLGLSFVAVVLEHHGAELEIESAPLHGTTFVLRIPLALRPQ